MTLRTAIAITATVWACALGAVILSGLRSQARIAEKGARP